MLTKKARISALGYRGDQGGDEPHCHLRQPTRVRRRPTHSGFRAANTRLHVVPAPGKPLPKAPNIPINNVNAYHGHLKEWMRRFHGVATKNLPNYLACRRVIEAWEYQVTPENWLLGAIGIGPYLQITLQKPLSNFRILENLNSLAFVLPKHVGRRARRSRV